MTIKDFKPGQTVYIAGKNQRKQEKIAMIGECTVISVGEKYITISWSGSAYNIKFFLQNDTDPFLTEKDNYPPRKLFLTKDEYELYKELLELRDFLKDASEYYNIKNYSLKQLRMVKDILEGKTDMIT